MRSGRKEWKSQRKKGGGGGGGGSTPVAFRKRLNKVSSLINGGKEDEAPFSPGHPSPGHRIRAGTWLCWQRSCCVEICPPGRNVFTSGLQGRVQKPSSLDVTVNSPCMSFWSADAGWYGELSSNAPPAQFSTQTDLGKHLDPVRVHLCPSVSLKKAGDESECELTGGSEVRCPISK